MTGLLKIEEAQARPTAPKWSAFLELGFRPFYLGASSWAALSILIWIYQAHWLNGVLPQAMWHAHEMLWGFVATVAVGFLLTAAGNWTGSNPLQGRALGALFGLWIIARIGFLLPYSGAFMVAAISEVVFFTWAACAIGTVIYRARSQRNYGVPVLVFLLGLLDAGYLIAAWRQEYSILIPRLYDGLLCMAIIAILISARVIPFFATRAVPGLTITTRVALGRWQLGIAVLALACRLMRLNYAAAVSLSLVGLIVIIQVLSWKPLRVRHQPLLWVLYFGYMALGLGLLAYAANLAGWVWRAAWAAHIIGIAGFSVLIIGMMTRTALGHSGRPLKVDRVIVAAYLLVITASALRLMALVPGSFSLYALQASVWAWVAAFVMYVWRFFPILIRPRLEAKAVKLTVTSPR